MKDERKKIIIDFTPFFALFAASVAVLLIYLFAMQGRSAVRIVQACVAPLVALVIPVLNRICKIRIPFGFNIAVAAFAFLAIDGAAVLNLYGLVPHFDKVLHTSFGVVGGLGVFIFMLYGKGEKLKPWAFFIAVFLGVMGLAALWEVYEYTASAITGGNVQNWKPDFGAVGDMTVNEFFKTYDPLWDTIWDMIVAAIGVMLFFGIILIDKLCGYKMCRRIYKQVNYREIKKEESHG